MIESNRVSLGGNNQIKSNSRFNLNFFLVLSYNTIRDYFSLAPIDFADKPIKIESLNERDVIVNRNIFQNYLLLFRLIQVFLLLCAQQNVHLHDGDSILHPYLLFSASHLCTQQQKNWWQTALELA
jgi:predicted CDP-diglyceride synthetase/phosphatidate cytidylyltransferase